ncbi:MAG: class I SAM-dependent methyltransferase [Flavobacteriales bacterium]|nr:class I SAM-dependent methyltransferase [Flavobacteriales bacterium]
MSKLKFLLNYAKYRFNSDNEHGIHSPFIFDLYNDVICDENPFYVYEDIESIRAKLLLTELEITIEDHGAGSKVNKSNTRKLKDITKNTVKAPKYGQLLFRLINRLKPTTILELGTSLGISTLYLAAPSKKIKVITVEGCPNTAKVAQINFDKIGFDNIELVNDTFDHFLPSYLAKVASLDLVFFDGNHQKDATINYFNLCVEKIHNDTVFIFDDIHWSEGMTEAWEVIKKHPKVSSTIDLYFMGIVFFNPDLSKEDFVLKF